MTDRVSVIVCTYKHDTEILAQSIESILAQNYKDIELIVADDGTNNFDIQKCADYIKGHSAGNIKNVIVYTNENNIGTVANINKAIKLTTGDYIRVIAGDDAYNDPTVFSTQINRLKADGHLFGVVGRVQQCDRNLCPIEDERIRQSNEYLKEMFKQGSDDIKRKIFRENLFPISIQTACFRRTFFEETGMVDEKYSVVDDLPLVQNIIDNIKRFCYVENIVTLHRVGDGISTTNDYFSRRKSAYYKDMYTFATDVWCKNRKIYGRLRPKMLSEIYRRSYLIAQSENSRGIRGTAGKVQILIIRIIVRPGEMCLRIFDMMQHKRKQRM